MASMNNWLGFSLSPQQLPSQGDNHQDHSQTNVSRLGFNSDEISGTNVSSECFDLTSDPSAPSLNLPHPFGILEAFNRNNQSQDWNMKGLDANYKGTADLSMLMGSSCNTQNQEPKLENFLGGPTVAATGAGEYIFPNGGGGGDDGSITTINGGGSNSSIGLSMIKTWLRNQPAPPSTTQPESAKNNGGAQTLSLSMSTGSSQLLTVSNGGASGGDSSSSDTNKQQKTTTTCLDSQTGAIEAVPRKSIDTFGQRTSIYRGVTRHRWTGRYEAHLWDNSCRREGQTRKGRQGGYDKEEKAARAYDLAALKYWGTTTTTNFPISNYEKELDEMKHMTRQEYVASLRRKSSGFSRGASIYRGVTRHHQHGRWQARIGRVAGNKDLYLGTFSTQEEAAEAYDIAAIKFRGLNAVTNFDMNRYDVKSILESSTLPIGGAAKRLKDVEQAEMVVEGQRADDDNISSQITADGISSYGAAAAHHGWPAIAFHQQPQPFSMQFPYGQRLWCKQEQDSDTSNSSFQDLHHQLQLGSTHNFFQPSVLHNLMSLDSSSMEHSSGSNSVIYSNGGNSGEGGGSNGTAANGGYYGSNNAGYVFPLGTVIASNDGNQNQGNGFGDGAEVNMFGSGDPYNSHQRNLYYLSHHQSSNAVKAASTYDQASTCNNWVPTAVPAIAQRSSTMAVGHGASTFTVWNDT
ncbi:hypothetical protein SLE2022_059460 [Rubroshorea leprosula]